MTDELPFMQDREYDRFVQAAAINLSGHEMSLRRLASLLNDLNYFARVARGGYDKLYRNKTDCIAYFETLRQVWITAIYPIYGDTIPGLKAKIDAAYKKVRENDFTVIDDLEVIEIEIIRKLNEKSLLYEIKEKIAGRVGLQ